MRVRALVALVGVVATLSCSQAPPAAPASPSPPGPAAESTPAAESSPAAESTPAAAPPATAATAAHALRYVALGDSLASGMGGGRGYPDVYRRLLERRTQRRVELTNLGRPGWTSSQLLGALRSDQRFRAAVAEADVVSWNIGGNDIIAAVLRSATGTCGGSDGLRCLRQTTSSFATRWPAIVDELVALRKSRDVALLTFDLYTPFLPPGARTDAVLDQLATMNGVIAASGGRSGVTVAPVADRFVADINAPLLSADGLHPSLAGHRVVARMLADRTVLGGR